MNHEKRHTTLDNAFANSARPQQDIDPSLLHELDDGIAATVETFVKPPREAASWLSLLALTCFIMTAAVLLNLFADLDGAFQ